LPACVAIIEHTPGARGVTVDALTVHTAGVRDVKLTGSPELAIADRLTVTDSITLGNVPNVIACVAWVTAKLRTTGGAGKYVEFPAWLAAIEHVPSATSVSVLLETVHTAGVFATKLTESPELAVAVS
jgi:hypothetical protein